MKKLRTLLSSAIFGSFDGATSTLGLLGLALSHPGQVPVAALGLALAGGVGMAAGSWLSDKDTSRAESVAIGIATAVGSMLPALPYIFLTGAPAVLSAIAVLIILGAVISFARAPEQGTVRAVAETYGVLLLVSAVVAASAWFTGAMG